MKRLISMTLALCILTGCSTTTRFHTKPEGAKIYINGDFLGESPYVFNDERSLPKRFHLQIRKEGYKELDLYIDKSFDYLGVFLSGFYGIFTFWGASLENDYHFNLSSLKIK